MFMSRPLGKLEKYDPLFSFWHCRFSRATPPKPGGTVGGIQYAASIGLDALELAWVNGVRVGEATCAAIKQAAEENGVALSVHAPYYINLNGDDEKWPRLRKYLMDAAHFGNLAGATDIIFHPGTYFGRPADEVLKVTIPRLQGCVDELRAAGNPVTLRPEISGKAAMLGSLSDVLEMAKAIPGVVPCIDFAHLHARLGDGAMNTYDEWMSALDYYRKIARRRSHAASAHPPVGHQLRSEGGEEPLDHGRS